MSSLEKQEEQWEELIGMGLNEEDLVRLIKGNGSDFVRSRSAAELLARKVSLGSLLVVLSFFPSYREKIWDMITKRGFFAQKRPFLDWAKITNSFPEQLHFLLKEMKKTKPKANQWLRAMSMIDDAGAVYACWKELLALNPGKITLRAVLHSCIIDSDGVMRRVTRFPDKVIREAWQIWQENYSMEKENFCCEACLPDDCIDEVIKLASAAPEACDFEVGRHLLTFCHYITEDGQVAVAERIFSAPECPTEVLLEIARYCKIPRIIKMAVDILLERELDEKQLCSLLLNTRVAIATETESIPIILSRLGVITDGWHLRTLIDYQIPGSIHVSYRDNDLPQAFLAAFISQKDLIKQIWERSKVAISSEKLFKLFKHLCYDIGDEEPPIVSAYKDEISRELCSRKDGYVDLEFVRSSFFSDAMKNLPLSLKEVFYLRFVENYSPQSHSCGYWHGLIDVIERCGNPVVRRAAWNKLVTKYPGILKGESEGCADSFWGKLRQVAPELVEEIDNFAYGRKEALLRNFT